MDCEQKVNKFVLPGKFVFKKSNEINTLPQAWPILQFRPENI